MNREPGSGPERRPRPTVLVAEDDPAVRRLLEVVLRSDGFDVVSAANGSEAVAAFHGVQVDAAILDVQMPGWDGVRTARALHRLDPRMRFFFLTGDPGRYSVADLVAAGAAAVFAKPPNVAEIVAALRQAVGAGGDTPGRSETAGGRTAEGT